MSRRSGTESRGPAPDGQKRPTRRDFCGLGALLAGTTCLSGGAAWAIGPGRPDFEGKESIYSPEDPLDDAANISFSTCLGCHGACPVRVVREGGVVARFDGNPFCPRVFRGTPPADLATASALRGALCARGMARLQNTYDPFRFTKALVREGERGGRSWKTATPSKVAELLSGVLSGLAGRTAEGLVVAVDPRQLDRASVLLGFQQALGGADGPAVQLGHPEPWMEEASTRLVGEPGWVFAPRWENAWGFLAWGADPFASGPDPVGDGAELARLFANRHSGPMIAVDPRLSDTAAKCDVWLPVRPGGDRALAWMLLRALQESGSATVPEAWFAPIRQFPWSEMERRSGLGEGIVRKAAELLALVGPRLALRVGGGAADRPGGTDAAEAVLRLAIVLGATGEKGAMGLRRSVARPGARPADALLQRLGRGSPISLLVLAGDAGLCDSPAWPEIKLALTDRSRVGFLAVVSTAPNPVSALADLVLPDLSEIERNGLVTRDDGLSLVRPAIRPILDESGLSEPWNRGLEGLLDFVAAELGASFSSATALERAIDQSGVGKTLRERGFAANPAYLGTVPAPLPFRDDASRDPGVPVEGLALVTWREAFGGFIDSSAQYWSQPSLTRRNPAWLHPQTAAKYGISEPGRVAFQAAELELLADLQITEGIRPGTVGLAVGYGHADGYDGKSTIDGKALPSDHRRFSGADVGRLFTEAGEVKIQSAPQEASPGLIDLLRYGLTSRERT